MEEEKIKKILMENLGLNEKEAEVYITLLKTGTTSTQRLSEITGINRVTLYDILRYLQNKGLAGSTILNKVKHFYAVKPVEILGIFKKEKEKIKEREEKIKAIIKELEKLREKIGEKSKVIVYEGEKSIDLVNQDVLKYKSIIAFGSFFIMNKIRYYDTIDFMKKRIKLRIRWKGVSDSEFLKNVYFKQSKIYRKLTEIRIDDSIKNLASWNYIYGNNKVGFLTLKKDNPIGIIIEDEIFYSTYKFLFEKLWRQAKPIQKTL